MKRIVVTPAGRQRYLEILFKYLKAFKSEFDRWDLWCNTTDQNDIAYMEGLASTYKWVNLVRPSVPVNGNRSIHSFFKNYVSPDEVYVRLDDDIVFIKKGSLKRLFNERIVDKDSFLLYGNIINNAVQTHLHQRYGHFDVNKGRADYNCFCGVAWHDPHFAESLHREFLANPKADYNMPDWILYYYERVSINVISWRGDEFAKFDGVVGDDEEQWLSVDKPLSISKPNKIIGDTLFVHYSFYTQRPHLDSTDILSNYTEMAP